MTNEQELRATNPVDTLALLKKCAEKYPANQCSISICKKTSGWHVIACNNQFELLAESESETLELAICLFAKHLLSGGKD